MRCKNCQLCSITETPIYYVEQLPYSRKSRVKQLYKLTFRCTPTHMIVEAPFDDINPYCPLYMPIIKKEKTMTDNLKPAGFDSPITNISDDENFEELPGIIEETEDEYI